MTRIVFLLLITVLFSCEKQDPPPGIYNPPSPPYDEPIWHPSGEIIGFYHRPIKEIHYNYGYDNPGTAKYIYEDDSAGFWLVDSDGTNQRRVLPVLHNPKWSPDGNWISFVQNGRTVKMPFDGVRFDTSTVVPVTTELCRYQTSWSPDGKQITFYKSNCDDDTDVGTWIKNLETGTEKFIDRYVFDASWHPTDDSLVYFKSDSIMLYDNTNDTKKLLLEISTKPNNNNNRHPQYSPSGEKITFLLEGAFLYSINPDGSGLTQLSASRITSYSWSPEGKIVYLNFDNRIDETQGTLWIMNADGTNKRQLTHNHFQVYP